MIAFADLTAKEQIYNLRAREFNTTLKVLRCYPADQLDMRPAEKSRNAIELIKIFIGEQYVCRAALQGTLPDSRLPQSWPDNLHDLLVKFEQIHAEVQDIITNSSDAQLTATVDFYGHQIRVMEVLWLELLDQIHHRGQFSVYLRLVGAKVPSIYGPTADEPM